MFRASVDAAVDTDLSRNQDAHCNQCIAMGHSDGGRTSYLLAWPKSLYSFFHTMAVVVLSCP